MADIKFENEQLQILNKIELNIPKTDSIKVPEPQSSPSTEFPEAPDTEKLFGNLGINTDRYFDIVNDPESEDFVKTSPVVLVEVTKNGEKVEKNS